MSNFSKPLLTNFSIICSWKHFKFNYQQIYPPIPILNFPASWDGKSICLQCGRPRFNPWVGKILWRRKWQPTPVLLPGKSHGWRSVVGYSPWGRKESDTTERRRFHFHTQPYFLPILTQEELSYFMSKVASLPWYLHPSLHWPWKRKAQRVDEWLSDCPALGQGRMRCDC